jgi:hypothetical protein
MGSILIWMLTEKPVSSPYGVLGVSKKTILTAKLSKLLRLMDFDLLDTRWISKNWQKLNEKYKLCWMNLKKAFIKPILILSITDW